MSSGQLENTKDNMNVENYDTNTDLLVSQLANTEKLVPKREQYHYGDTNSDINNINVDEKIDTLLNNENNGVDEQNEQIPQNNVQPFNTNNHSTNNITTNNNVTNENPHKIESNEQEEEDEYEMATPLRKKLLKLDMLRKLSELTKKGVKLSKDYGMDDDYGTMKFEYNIHHDLRQKHGTVRFLNDCCMNGVNSIEKALRKYEYPLGINLDGWYEDVSDKKEQLYDAFDDLYERYHTPGKGVSPEFKLAGLLGVSGISRWFINSELNNVPSVQDIQKKDPNVIANIQKQAMAASSSSRNGKNTTVYEGKLTKEYKNALTQMQDYNKYVTNSENVGNPNQPPKNEQYVMNMPKMPSRLSNKAYVQPPSSMTPEQFKSFRELEINNQRKEFEKALLDGNVQRNPDKKEIDNVSHKSTSSTKSSLSVISRNPELDKIIKDADEKSQLSNKRKGRPKKNAKK